MGLAQPIFESRTFAKIPGGNFHQNGEAVTGGESIEHSRPRAEIQPQQQHQRLVDTRHPADCWLDVRAALLSSRRVESSDSEAERDSRREALVLNE